MDTNTQETTYWSCEGPKNRPHRKRELESFEICPECGRDRTTAQQEDKQNESSNSFGKIIIGVALLSFLGLGSLYFVPKIISLFNPQTERLEPLKNNPEDYSWEPTRFTKGQRTLFPGKPNDNRDLGIKAFQNRKYDDAVKFFKQAVDENRNDPEVLILYNNALARQQSVLQQKNNPLTLAAVVPVEGNQDFAEQMLRGIAMAQNEFNKSGGVNWQLLEIVIANDGNQTENATKVAEELVKDKSVLGVIGHNSSDASEAGLKIYEPAKLAMISPTSTSTSFNSDVFFRTVSSDEAAGKKLADYIYKKLKLTKVVIFYNPNSSYSNSLYNAFANTNNFGGTIVTKIDISDPTINIKNEFYASVHEENAQAALLFPNTLLIGNAIRIAKANANLKENRIKLFGGDALYSSQTLIAGGEAVEDLILAVPWIDQIPESQAFQKFGQEQWGGSVNWRTAMSYDATQAFIAAFSANPNPNRASILSDLPEIELAADDTSGEKFEFTREGESLREPVLVRATSDAEGRPKGSKFGFELIK